MSNELSLFDSTFHQLVSSLNDNDKLELAKYATKKQLELEVELMRAQQSGIQHETEVNAAISKAAAAAEVDVHGKRGTTYETTIRSLDGRITTHISSRKTLF